MRTRVASSTSSSDGETPDAGAAPPRAALRGALILGVSWAIVAGLLLGSVWICRDRLRLPGSLQGDVETGLLPALERWRQGRTPGVAGAAVFGDSRVDCGHGVTVGTALAQHLGASGRPTEVVDAAHPLFRPLQFYYLLDDVLAGRPAITVIEVNPAFLWPKLPPPQDGLRFLNLSRRLSLGRAWRIRTALAADGLTLLDPLLYRLEARFDLLFVADGIRDDWQERLHRYGLGFNRLLGASGETRRPRPGSGAAFATADETRPVSAGGPTTHPVTIVLREMYRALRAAGVEILFYIPAGRVGAGRDERTIEAVRGTVGATSEEWLNLRALLPAGEFRDAGGHMVPAGCARVAGAIRDVLLPRLARREHGG